MAPFSSAEDVVHHGLRADFDGLNPVFFQERQAVFVNVIRSCGNSDGMDPSSSDRKHGIFQQSDLFLLSQTGEIAAVKGNLNISRCFFDALKMRQNSILKLFLRNFLWIGPHRFFFIAENTAMGAAPIHDKERNNQRHGQSPAGVVSFSSASRAFSAACCSASFLFFPVPAVMILSVIDSSISKVLS